MAKRVKVSTVQSIELKIVPIGNSRGIRIPKELLERYAMTDTVLAEVREEGLLLRGATDTRLSWEETYREMAREREDWSDLDATIADGLDSSEKW